MPAGGRDFEDCGKLLKGEGWGQATAYVNLLVLLYYSQA